MGFMIWLGWNPPGPPAEPVGPIHWKGDEPPPPSRAEETTPVDPCPLITWEEVERIIREERFDLDEKEIQELLAINKKNHDWYLRFRAGEPPT